MGRQFCMAGFARFCTMDRLGRNGFQQFRTQKDGQFAFDRIPDEGKPAHDRAEMARKVGADGPVRPDSREPRRTAAVRAARRAAVCQRQHPPGPCVQQDPEGFHHQVEDDGGLRFAVCPRVGLPRPADRDQGRQPIGRQKGLDERGPDPRRVPQVRPEVRRSAKQIVPTAWSLRTLGKAVPDDEPRLRSRHGGERSSTSSARARSTRV